MFAEGCRPDQRILFGELVVRLVDPDSGRPIPGVRIGIAGDLGTACRKG